MDRENLRQLLIKYIEENPNKLNDVDKDILWKDFNQHWDIKRSTLYQRTDFYSDFINYYAIELTQVKVLTRKIAENFDRNIKILDICSGRNCLLGRKLHQLGFQNVTCKDPRARKIFEAEGIAVKTGKLTVEDFRTNDLITGNFACEVAEMLLREGKKHDTKVLFTVCRNPKMHRLSINDIPIDNLEIFLEELMFIGGQISLFPIEDGLFPFISNFEIN